MSKAKNNSAKNIVEDDSDLEEGEIVAQKVS